MDSDVFDGLLEISFYLSHLWLADDVTDNMRSREWKETRSSEEENTFTGLGGGRGDDMAATTQNIIWLSLIIFFLFFFKHKNNTGTFVCIVL